MSDSFIFKHLKDYWVIYFCIGAFIATNATSGGRISALEAEQVRSQKIHSELTDKIDDQSVQFAEIKARLASIDTSLQYLKEKR